MCADMELMWIECAKGSGKGTFRTLMDHENKSIIHILRVGVAVSFTTFIVYSYAFVKLLVTLTPHSMKLLLQKSLCIMCLQLPSSTMQL